MNPPDALLAFVRDVTAGDAEAIQSCERWLANPPDATVEEMGFYPRGDESEFERSFRRTISMLAKRGFLRTIEDKYISEMFAQWLDSGFLPLEHLSGDAARFLRTFGLESPEELEDPPTDEVTEAVQEQLISVALEVERSLHAASRRLLSLDLSGGDTFYAFQLAEGVAERWRDVSFENLADDEYLACRGFDWELYASWLQYCLDLDDLELDWPDELRRQPLRPVADVEPS